MTAMATTAAGESDESASWYIRLMVNWTKATVAKAMDERLTIQRISPTNFCEQKSKDETKSDEHKGS
jgi:hypothetical protein